MSHPIKVFETDEGTAFEMDYSEDILEMYSDNYFSNRGTQAKIVIVVDKEEITKGGGQIQEDHTLTIPYRYFHYRAKYLSGIRGQEKKEDTPQQEEEEPIEKKEDVTKEEHTIEKKEKSVFIDFFKGIPGKIMGFFNGLKDLGRNVETSIYTNPLEVKPVKTTTVTDSREHVDSEKNDSNAIDIDDISYDEKEEEGEDEDMKKIRIIVNSKEIKKIEKDKLTYKELGIILNTLNEKMRKNIIWEKSVYIVNNRCAILNIEEEEGEENEKLLSIWEGSEIYKRKMLYMKE